MDDGYNRVTVEVGGQVLTLRTQNDPEYVRALAKYVDEKIESIARKNPRLSTSHLALLAAINLADEIHNSRSSASGGAK